jgi:hypothetical protein
MGSIPEKSNYVPQLLSPGQLERTMTDRNITLNLVKVVACWPPTNLLLYPPL